MHRLFIGLLASGLLAAPLVAQSSVTLDSTELVFNFDFSTATSPAPPYVNISFSAVFDASDPVAAGDAMVTNVYGGLNGSGLIQVRNDTSLVVGGTTYGPLTTANPIFDPMLDGVFSFGLRMSAGTARLVSFTACGNVSVPSFSQSCKTYTPGVPVDPNTIIDTGAGASASAGGLILSGKDNLLGAGFWQYLAGRVTLSQSERIGSVLGWMYVNTLVSGPATGTARVAIHANAAGTVGAELHSANFEMQCATSGCGLAEWKGVSGLNWKLGPGQYWIVMSVPDGSPAMGVMPGNVPNPLPAYRWYSGGTGNWNTLANVSQHHIGFLLLRAPSVEVQLEALSTAVAGVGPGSSYADKIALAKAYYAVPDIQSACAIMTDFLNQVRAQTGKKLSVGQAAALTADAVNLMAAMGCE
jgi:hypothetical protein